MKSATSAKAADSKYIFQENSHHTLNRSNFKRCAALNFEKASPSGTQKDKDCICRWRIDVPSDWPYFILYLLNLFKKKKNQTYFFSHKMYRSSQGRCDPISKSPSKNKKPDRWKTFVTMQSFGKPLWTCLLQNSEGEEDIFLLYSRLLSNPSRCSRGAQTACLVLLRFL